MESGKKNPENLSAAVHSMMNAHASLNQMSNEWWDQVRNLLELETGMDLTGSRGARLRDAISSMGQISLPSITELITDAGVRSLFVERITAELTVGESFFLRNPHHMELLRKIVFPKILEEKQSQREVHIWSAGCAGGEEPYSLAILLDPLLDNRDSWHVNILGTDLNPEFLERGRLGYYRQWSFRQTDVQNDVQYFKPVRDGFQINERIRQQVRFRYLNFVKDTYPSVINGTIGLDLILFRNVAIYLKAEVTSAILERMYRSLRPGGWLLLGETEVTLSPSTGFEIHRFPNATIFRKPVDAPIDVGDFLVPAVAPVIAGLKWPGPQAAPSLPEWTPLPEIRLSASLPAGGDQPHQLIAWKAPGLPEDGRSAEARERAQNYLNQAKELWGKGEPVQARAQLALCVKEDSLCLEAHLMTAGILEDLGDWRAAEQSYRRALYLDRRCVVSHFHLGLLLQQMGDSVGSLRSLKTSRELAAQHAASDLVEYGDGICYGRLLEMIAVVTGETHE